MHLNDYQIKARKTAIYPGQGTLEGLDYVSQGLMEEVGEIAGHLKRIKRDDKGVLTFTRKNDILGEIGDALWYLAMLADELEAEFNEIANRNVDKLERRKQQNKLHGKGSNR